MSTQLPRSERPRKQPVKKASSTNPTQLADNKAAEVPPTAPKTTREQRYVAPEERHSQQTQRRARESAAAGGHATEKEQLAHERTVVEANFVQRTQDQQKKREQKTSAKVQLPPTAPVAKGQAPEVKPE